MTISSYSELKTALATWSGRSDTTSRDDEAIDMWEGEVNRRVRVRNMETSATGNMVSGTATISLPTDFLEIRTITYVPATGSIRKLEYVTPEQADAFEYAGNGAPQWYTFVGGAIALYPTPDSTYAYTIKYYARLSALSSSSGYTTNWLLSNNPDLYLAGSIKWIAALNKDGESLAAWKGQVEEGLAQLERQDRRERFVTPVVNFDNQLRAFPSNRNIETDGE